MFTEKKILLVSFYISTLYFSTALSQNIVPFNIPIDNTIDTFFGKAVPDPFRWLENTESEDTKNWIKFQEERWNSFKKVIKNEINNAGYYIENSSVTRFNHPVRMGKYFFQVIRWDIDPIPCLYMSETPEFKFPTTVFDPRHISKSDNIQIIDFNVSKDSKYIFVKFTRNGSDAHEIKIISLKNRKMLPDHLTNVLYSNVVWLKDGFIYTTYNIESKFSAAVNPEVYYHKLGTEQQSDILIFKRQNSVQKQFRYIVAHDDSTIILKEVDEKNEVFNLFLVTLDLINSKSNVKPVMMNIPLSYNLNVFNYLNNTLLAYTNYDAPNGSVVAIDIDNPQKWTTVINEFTDAVLMGAHLLSDSTFLCTHRHKSMLDVASKMSANGVLIKSCPVVRGLTINEVSELDKSNMLVRVGFPVLPPVVYNLNTDSMKLTSFDYSEITYRYDRMDYTIKNYYSDGQYIPILLIYNKGVKLDGNNPVLLEAFGGFGVLTTHHFNPGIVNFINQGGIYAYAYVRGNGDLGDKYAKDGKMLNKTNVINDLINAAEYLIQEKYTSRDKLAITGGSHGGMLVAAAMVKRPDLFKVVVPVAGVYDMLRFEQFTVGQFHIDEFGTVKNEIDFTNLYSYSPYHNIDTTVNYPTTLIFCGDNDDRVTTFQSYKFVARLQTNPAQKNPVLFYTLPKSGHYGPSTYNESKKYITEQYGAIMHFLKK
jgi:prolyl oligopeptidase